MLTPLCPPHASLAVCCSPTRGVITRSASPSPLTSPSPPRTQSLQKKGILKKRHCSESSADELLSPSTSSLITGSLVSFDEAEEATIKKSVSFSNHVVEKRYRCVRRRVWG